MIYGVFENWGHFLEVLGVWLAAFATAAATIVALRVSSRDLRQELKVAAKPMLSFAIPAKADPIKVFVVSATNVGRRPVTTANVSVRCSLPFYNAIVMMALPGSSPMTTTLQDGETATWSYPIQLDGGEDFYSQFATPMLGKNWLWKKLFLRRLAWTVETSLGNLFRAKPDKLFRSSVELELKKMELVK